MLERGRVPLNVERFDIYGARLTARHPERVIAPVDISGEDLEHPGQSLYLSKPQAKYGTKSSDQDH